MKKIISVLLALALCANLAACGGSGPGGTAADPKAPNDQADEEVQKAIDLGLVPDNLQGNHDAQIIYAEFCQVLDNATALLRPTASESWKEISSGYRDKDNPMTRMEGAVVMLYAAENSGLDTAGYQYRLSMDEMASEGTDHYGNTPENFPLLPDIHKPYYNELYENKESEGWRNGQEHWYYSRHFVEFTSFESGKTYFDYDEDYTMKLDAPFTRGDAIRAVLRFYETARYFCYEPIKKTAVQAQKPWYLPIDEVGTYNMEIITDEILNGCTLGEITADNLPYWNGLILENKAFINCLQELWTDYTPGDQYWTEDQIRFQAEQGFNCIRALYSFSYLSSHPEDFNTINMAQLEQLDELLSWCMKYNLHLMISITGLPGMEGEGKEREDIVFNDALFYDETMRRTFQDYWLMLARRYADIPSGALSFELEAEGSCKIDGGPDMQRFFDTLAPIARGIWEVSPNRIVIVNDNSKEVPEQLAEIGCCLSLHTHVYNYSDFAEDFGLTDVEHRWPMEHIPRYFHSPENGTLKLVSENGFRAGSLKACFIIYEGRPLEVRCGGTVVPAETEVNEQGVTILTAQVPDGTKEIELAPAGEEYSVELIMVELRQEGRERVQLNVPVLNFVPGEVFPTLRVGDDGTLTNLSGQLLIDGEWIYENHVKKFVECAERNHVGFLETEIGTDTTVLSVEEYLAYHTMWLDMMKEHHAGWMYNCERNIFAPKDLMWLNGQNNPIPFERFSQWEGGPYWINDDVMELLKAYQ